MDDGAPFAPSPTRGWAFMILGIHDFRACTSDVYTRRSLEPPSPSAQSYVGLFLAFANTTLLVTYVPLALTSLAEVEWRPPSECASSSPTDCSAASSS